MAVSGCVSTKEQSLQAPAGLRADDACIAGTYNGAASEIAARVLLQDDGSFDYLLIYGALDEQASGRWSTRDGKVLLTSDPVTEPELTLVEERPAGDDDLHIELDVPGWLSRQYFDAVLDMSDGSVATVQFAEEGLIVPAADFANAVRLRILLPIANLASDPHALTGTGGQTLRYRFRQNDLGKVAFAGKPLAIEPGALVLERHERRLRLLREEEGCDAR